MLKEAAAGDANQKLDNSADTKLSKDRHQNLLLNNATQVHRAGYTPMNKDNAAGDANQ